MKTNIQIKRQQIKQQIDNLKKTDNLLVFMEFFEKTKELLIKLNLSDIIIHVPLKETEQGLNIFYLNALFFITSFDKNGLNVELQRLSRPSLNEEFSSMLYDFPGKFLLNNLSIDIKEIKISLNSNIDNFIYKNIKPEYGLLFLNLDLESKLEIKDTKHLKLKI